MTAWHRNESILKGLFLGLWIFVALQVGLDRDAVRTDLPWVLGWVAAGLLVALIAGVVVQLARGVRPWRRPAAFIPLVLLESPALIYAGVLIGLAAGVLSGREFAEPWAGKVAGWFGLTFADIKHVTSAGLPDDDPRKGKLPGDWLGYCAIGGIVLGFALHRLRQVPDPRWRWGIGLVVAAVAIYLGQEYVGRVPGLDATGPEGERVRFNLGLYILVGLPFFYLLAFCGESEESEAELMTLCGALGLSLALMNVGGKIPGAGGAFPVLIPVGIYFAYSTRVLPGLRVFKHTLRGFSYLNLGRLREAIVFFRRALELDPQNALARQGMLALHRNITLARIDADPRLAEVLDFSLCLDRAETLLRDRPTAEQRAEADRFLELVERKQPAYQARVDYLRAVAAAWGKDYDAAAESLRRLLDPEITYHPTVRRAVLYPAWNLALVSSAEIERRVGWKELDRPGRRVEAIAAVERHLAANPQDTEALGIKRTLYEQLSEAEFVAAAAATNAPPKEFNYEYVEQLGLALADDPDPDRRERGMAYLRIAGRGMPERGPGIFTRLADAAQKANDPDARRGYLEQVKRSGLQVGPGKLAKDQRDLYHHALRKLADDAEARGDAVKAEADAARDRGDPAGMAAKDEEARPQYEAAIADLRLYLEAGGRNELETYRKLAGLYGKARATPNAIINAVLMVETGLTYDRSDPDLLRKKDSFYYSVEPEKLAAVKDRVSGYFDTGYCVRKAMSILNAKTDDPEMLDWADHLAKLATVMEPTGNGVRLVRARCLLRRGERDEGLRIMEDIREGKKGSGDEEESWYAATKILGQLYIDELDRPDLALQAFKDYQEYHRSGADTLFQIARSYEAMNDRPNAIKFYNAVTAYEEHPRYWDAKEALRRLGAKTD